MTVGSLFYYFSVGNLTIFTDPGPYPARQMRDHFYNRPGRQMRGDFYDPSRRKRGDFPNGSAKQKRVFLMAGAGFKTKKKND